jgi:hypothetical protein
MTGREGPLKGRFIFLSASTPTRDLEKYPRLQMEVEKAVIELARTVFNKGGRLVFGGHPNISPLVASVAGEYFKPDPSLHLDDRPIQIYQSKAYEKVIPPATQSLASFGYAAIRWTDAVNGEQYDPTNKESQCHKSLLSMRQQMLKTEPLAMVATGGMDGVAEEAGLFLQSMPGPVFAMRTTGGVSSELPWHTFDWCKRQDSRVAERVMEQVEKRIMVLEDVYPAPRLPGSDWKLRPDHATASYAFHLQKMIRDLIQGRWS